MSPIACDTLIVGAGIAGLSAAHSLKRRSSGLHSILLDKSRGPGGRCTTRRFDFRKGSADHGAMVLEPRENEDLEKEWDDLLKSLRTREAPPHFPAGSKTFPDGMNALPKTLAEGLDLRLNQTVVRIKKEEKGWSALTLSGESFEAPKIIVTSPLPQTAQFFAEDESLVREIERLAKTVHYIPRWTLFAFEGEPYAANQEGFQKFTHPVLESLTQQSQKGLKDSGGIYVIQTTESFSENYLEDTAEDITAKIQRALKDFPGLPNFERLIAHRWRYAFVKTPLGRPSWQDPRWPGLILAGDFALGSTLVRAALSGLSAAESCL